MDLGEHRAACLVRFHADQRAAAVAAAGNFLPRRRPDADAGQTVYGQCVFDTVSILLSEAARVVHRRAESIAIRFFTHTPAVIARVFGLGAAVERLHLDRAVQDAAVQVAHTAEDVVETAAGEVAATAGPLVLIRSAKALAGRRRSLPLAALAAGALGLTAIALRRAARPRRR
jgi:hypothetical protein